MSTKVGEIGRDIFIGTGFNLSAATELTIRFTNPDGTVKFDRDSSDGVTAPPADSPDIPDIGVFIGNTYMKYTTVAADFDAGGPGDWVVCVNYQDATPKSYDGDDTILNIGEACD